MDEEGNDSPCFVNPEPPDDTNLRNSLQEEVVGCSSYTKLEVLKLLNLLADLSKCEWKREDIDASQEADLCQFWDMTSDLDICEFVQEFQILSILPNIVSTQTSERLAEICFGTLGNLLTNLDFIPPEQVQPIISLICCRMSDPDSLTLIQILRCLNCILQKFSEEIIISEGDRQEFLPNYGNILSNNRNQDLLLQALSLFQDYPECGLFVKPLSIFLQPFIEAWSELIPTKASNFSTATSVFLQVMNDDESTFNDFLDSTKFEKGHTLLFSSTTAVAGCVDFPDDLESFVTFPFVVKFCFKFLLSSSSQIYAAQPALIDAFFASLMSLQHKFAQEEINGGSQGDCDRPGVREFENVMNELRHSLKEEPQKWPPSVIKTVLL